MSNCPKTTRCCPKWVVAKWAENSPPTSQTAVTFHDGLMQDMDAVIATGGANASRYFEAYFGHLPHLFRGHAPLWPFWTGTKPTANWAVWETTSSPTSAWDAGA